MFKVPFIILILLVLAFGRLDRIFLKENGSFNPKFILPRWDRCLPIQTAPYIGKELDQPYTYLTKGKQAYVFLSADGKWVIKFLRLPRYMRRYSFSNKSKSTLFFNQTLKSYELAYRELQDETQVVYAHLQPTTFFKKPLTIIDKWGQVHALDPNILAFVVQRKGDPFFSVFDKGRIETLVAFFQKLHSKKIQDHDAILEKNYGVYNNTPFIMDIGQLEQVPHLPKREEYVKQMTHGIGYKLQKESPELYQYYEKFLQRNP